MAASDELRSLVSQILDTARRELSRFIVGSLSGSGVFGVVTNWWKAATHWSIDLQPSSDSALQLDPDQRLQLTRFQNLDMVAAVITAVLAGCVLVLILRLRNAQGVFPTLEITRVRRTSRLLYLVFFVITAGIFILLLWDWTAFNQLFLGNVQPHDVRWLWFNVLATLAAGLVAGSLIYAGIVFTFAPPQLVVLAAPPLPLARWVFRRLQRI